MATTKSITETGPKALRGIRNPDLYPSKSLGLSDIELQSIQDNLARSTYANYNAAHGHLGYQGLNDQSLYSPQINQELDYGSSTYDEGLLLDPVQQDINNKRADDQSALAKAVAGITKGVILAGTSFIDGTAGLIQGLGQGIYNIFDEDKDTSFSQGLWDNSITQLMGQLNDAAEKELVNYRTEEETNGPWYSIDNLTSANFIFDTIVKNTGFTVGAAFSGGVYTKAISWGAKALGLARLGKASAATIEAGQEAMEAARATKATKALVGSFFNAHAEAVQEAYNSSQDFIRTTSQEIDSRAAEQRSLAIQEFIKKGGSILADGSPNPASDPSALAELKNKFKQIDEASTAAKKEAIKQSKNVGTMDGLLNIPILWLSNVAMFGKMYAGGWESARNANRTITRATKEAVKRAKEAAKAGDMTELNKLTKIVSKAEQTGYQGLSEVEKSLVEEAAPHLLGKKAGVTWAAIKGPLREGNEEMMQGAAAQAATYKYSNEVDKIFDSKLNLESSYKVRGVLESIMEGLRNQYGDIDNYEEAFVGAFTGLLGSPTFGRRNNSTDQTYLGKSKWIGLTGGSITEVMDYLRDRRTADKAAKHATEVLRRENLADDIKHLIAQTHFNDTMDRAVIHDDEKEYKDARTASIFEMVSHLKRVGRLDLLQRAMATTTQFTDEDIAEIAESVSKEVSATTPDVSAKVQQRKRVEKEIETMLETYEELYKEAFDTGDSSKIDATDEMLKQKKAELAKLDAEIEQAKPVSVSPYIHKDGTVYTAEEIKQDIDKRVQQFQKIIDTISLSQDQIDEATSGTLTNEQLDTLTWYKVMMNDWNERAEGITTQWKQLITKLAEDPKLGEAVKSIQEVEDLLEEAGFKPSEGKVQLGGRFDTLRKIKNHHNILQQLQEAVSSGGINLAYLLTSTVKPEGVDSTVGEIISKQLEQELKADQSVSEDIKKAFLKNLNDLKSIGQGHRKYNELLDEYLKNPEKIDQAHQASVNRAQAKDSKQNLSGAIDGIDWNSPAGTIAKYLRDNASKIQSAGGFEKFIQNLTPEQKKKAREAQKLVMGIDSLDSLIDQTGLEDEHAQILRGIIDEAIDDSDTIQQLAQSVKESIQEGEVEELIRRSVPEDQSEELTLRQIEDAETTLSEFIDDNLQKLANASEEAQRAIDAEQERVKQLAEKTKESSDDEISSLASKTTEPKEPTEAPSEDTLDEPSEDEDYQAPNPTSPTDAKKANKKASISPQSGQPGYNRRRQISQYYLHGIDKETLPQHYEEHPEDIPAGVDKDAFLKYIKAVHKKLVESGAYTYISGVNPNLRLKEGQEIRFTTDKKLNEDAGVPVILMVVTDEQGHDQIIGSLPTSLDFQAKQRGGTKTVGEVYPEDKALYDTLCSELLSEDNSQAEKDSSQTEAVQPKEMPFGTRINLGLPGASSFKSDKSVDKEDARFEAVTSNGVTYFQPIISESHIGTIKSTDAYGNAVEFIGGAKSEATEFVIIEPGEATKNEEGKLVITKKAKVFAVTPSTPFNSQSTKATIQQSKQSHNVSSITTKVESLRGGHPSFSAQNRSVSEVFGDNLLPITIILAKGPKSSSAVKNPADLQDPINGQVYVYVTSNTGKQIPLLCFSTPLKDLATNDWYIEQTVEAIQKLSQDINLGSAKEGLLRWLPFLDNLHVNITEIKNGKAVMLGWGRNKEGKIANTYTLRMQEDGTIASKDALQFIKSIAGRKITLPSGEKMYPTTNVDRNQINNEEYLKNISRYIKINVTSNSPRTIDDWFTYAPTKIQKKGKRPSRTNPAVPGTGKKASKEIVDTPTGQVTISSAGTVTAEGDNVLTEAEEAAILARVPKGEDIGDIDKKPSKSILEEAFGSSSSNEDDDMPDIPKRRRRRKPKDGEAKFSLAPQEIPQKTPQYTPEMQSIKAKAIANGTFMKAPNGNPTNLNERQWLQVRTKAFKEWFGDWENNPEKASKVVDENGEPLVVYHGNRTDNKITTFDLSKKGTEHKERAISGFWFTTDKDIAKEEYALKPESRGRGIEYLQYGEVIPVFLNIKNPIKTEQQGITVRDTLYGILTTAKEKLDDFINRSKTLARENTDGYILTLVDSDNRADDFVSKQTQLVVFNPNQIKSATDNTGEFSTVEDDIRLLSQNATQDQIASQTEIQKDLDKLSAMFPKLAKEGRIVLVKGLLNVVDNSGNPRQAYGMFRNGVLYISDQSPKGTAFHEAFHYIADTLLSDTEWETMFDEAAKLWGNLPEIELEEHLAEAFREFMNERQDHSIKGRLKTIFQKLKHIVLSIVGRENYLDNLFWSIYRNKMQNRTDNTSQDTFKQELLEYKTKKLKYSNLDQETRDYLKARQFTEENYEKLSIEQKEILLQCM